jgi:hypothetical protein
VPICPLAWVAVAEHRAPHKDGLTHWFSGNIAPAREGWYERHFTDSQMVPDASVQFWNGVNWLSKRGGEPHWRQVGDYPAWRGLIARWLLTGRLSH